MKFSTTSIFQSLMLLRLIAQAASQQHDDVRLADERPLQQGNTTYQMPAEKEDSMPESTRIAIVVIVTCIVLVGLGLFARFFIIGNVEDKKDESTPESSVEFESEQDHDHDDASSKLENRQSERDNGLDDSKRVRFAEA